MELPEDFLKQFETVKKDLKDAQENSWNEVLESLDSYFEEIHLPKGNPLRETYVQMFYDMWNRGYHAGSYNIMMSMAKELGLGPLMNVANLIRKQATIDPTKN